MHSIRGWIVVLFAGGKSTNVSLESSPSLAAAGAVNFTRSKSHRSRSIAASFRVPRAARRPSSSPPRSHTTESLDAAAVAPAPGMRSSALPLAEAAAPLAVAGRASMVAMGGAAVAGGECAAAAVDQPDASSFQITGI